MKKKIEEHMSERKLFEIENTLKDYEIKLEEAYNQINEQDKIISDKERHIQNIENSRSYRLAKTIGKIGHGYRGTDTKKRIEKKPRVPVSVIIPNYNYASFLKERIESIFAQTVLPAEIIFLDDCSTDKSLPLARKLLKKSPIPYKIISNKENAGCFNQWIKGVDLAENNWVWIAEADDSCLPDMLARLYGMVNDDIVFAYANSFMIDENGEKSGDYHQYLSDLDALKWANDYVNNGVAEIKQALGAKNTIPNASACLMKKSAFEGIAEELDYYKAAGDWFVYLYLIKQGEIAYCSEKLNLHRRHSQSIMYKETRTFEVFKETLKIRHYILDHFALGPNALTVMRKSYENDLDYALQVAGKQDVSREEILGDPYRTFVEKIKEKSAAEVLKKNLLVVIISLTYGGAEIAPIRAANYFANKYNVYLYCSAPVKPNPVVVKMLSPEVVLLNGKGSSEEIAYYLEHYTIDAINSNSWDSDYKVYKALGYRDDIVWIITMHGHYELLITGELNNRLFVQYGEKVLNRADHITYLTEKNLDIFDYAELKNKNKLIKHYNGYEVKKISPKKRAAFGIKEDDFVYGMVSRGIPAKGFEDAVEAFQKLPEDIRGKSHLVLVGESQYMERLENKYYGISNIHVINKFSEPDEWLAWMGIFQVGLLPSRFRGESLPTVIIEYLAYGKPVIANKIGETQNMIQDGDKTAGICVELLKEKRTDIGAFSAAMQRLYEDKDFYKSCQEATSVLFEKFSMETFSAPYYEWIDNE